MYGLYTFSLILLLGAPGQVAFEAEERGVEILVGVGLLVVGLFIVHAIAGRLANVIRSLNSRRTLPDTTGSLIRHGR